MPDQTLIPIYTPNILPIGATQLTADNLVANAAINLSLGAAVGKTTYISGLAVSGLGATAATVVICAINTSTNSYNFYIAVPAGATVPLTPYIVNFAFPISAGALNTAITGSLGAFGLGNTNAALSIWGFRV